MAELMLRPLGVGEIIDHSLAIYRRQFAPLLVITLTANAVPLLLMVYLMTAGGILENAGLYLVVILLSVVLGALATAATVFLVSETYMGNTMSGGEAIRLAGRFVGRLVLLTMMMGLVAGLAVLAPLLPGLAAGSEIMIAIGSLPGMILAVMVFTGLLVATPALVVEDIGATKALNRSWHLTRGSRWKMLGLVLVVVIIILIPSIAIMVLRGGGMAMPQPGGYSTADIMWELASQFISTLIYPLLYCALTVAYYDLRVRKEGFDLELLESSLARTLPSGPATGIGELPGPGSY